MQKIIVPRKFAALASFILSLFLIIAFMTYDNEGTKLDIEEISRMIFDTSRSPGNSDIKGESDNLFLVVRVIDGDTIVLDNSEKVRLIGIDSPEISHPGGADECYGEESKRFTKDLLENKMVRLEKDVSERDRYQRLLRYVWLDDVFVNDKLVREGYALASSYPPDVRYQDLFMQAQQEAMENNRGLWGSCDL